MKFKFKVLLLLILIFSACKESPQQGWLRASSKLREASKIYLSLAESILANAKAPPKNQAVDTPEKEDAAFSPLTGFAAIHIYKRCGETAGKLENFVQSESPTKEKFDSVSATLSDMLKEAENFTTNDDVSKLLKPDERSKFIAACALVKEAGDVVNKSQP
jgi:hypothetical protein